MALSFLILNKENRSYRLSSCCADRDCLHPYTKSPCTLHKGLCRDEDVFNVLYLSYSPIFLKQPLWIHRIRKFRYCVEKKYILDVVYILLAILGYQRLQLEVCQEWNFGRKLSFGQKEGWITYNLKNILYVVIYTCLEGCYNPICKLL